MGYHFVPGAVVPTWYGQSQLTAETDADTQGYNNTTNK